MFENLPKVNHRMSQSEDMQNKLALEIIYAIQRLEKDHDYEFLPYEVDLVLIDKIRRHHYEYLKQAFKPKKEKRNHDKEQS